MIISNYENSENRQNRLKRFKKRIKSKGFDLSKITKIHDHKGILEVSVYDFLSKLEVKTIKKAWKKENEYEVKFYII